jgi:hypothetical protein
MGLRRLRTVLACAALVVGSADVARAQDTQPADSAAEARSQYQKGTQAFQAKRYSEAALHFEAAAAFKANAVALFTAGLAWDNAARPERAADAYARALDVGGLEAKQNNVARDRVAALESTLGTLFVTAPEGWKVQLDTFTEVPTPARLHATPGTHALSVRAPGRPIERRDVTLEGGKTTPLDLRDEAKTSPKPPPTEPDKPKPSEPTKPKDTTAPPPVVHVDSFWNARRAIGVGVAGIGLAALGGGAILGINANGARDAYIAAPSQEGFDHASSLETWTNVAFIAGGVLLVGGVVLVVLPDFDGRAQVGIGPNGASLRGTF